MKSKHFKIFFLFISAIILTLGLSISFQSLLADAVAPLDNPPACLTGNPGCDAPLNVGVTLQQKTGGLWLNTTTNPASIYGLIVEHGKVGIGNPDPYYKLDVAGSLRAVGEVSAVGAVYVKSADQSRTMTLQVSSGFEGEIYGPSTYGLSIYPNTGNPVAIRVRNDGNVGIGTTNPSRKLEVRGAILVSELTQNQTVGYFSGAGVSAPTVGIENANGAGGIALRVSNLGGSLGDRRAAEFISEGGVAGYFNSNGGTTALIVDQGNVGIGTTNPGAKLDVQGDTNISGDVSLVNNKSIKLNSVSNTTLFVGNYNTGGFAYGTGQTASLAVEGDIKGNQLCIKEVCQNSWSGIGGTSGWTDDGTAVRLTTISDKVGIGTASPSRILHIEGSGSGRGQISLMQSGTVATDSSAGIYWYSNSDYAIYRTLGAWTASNYQQLKLDWPTGIILDPGTGDNAGYNKSYVEITGGKGLRVTQGNVGIGTVSPGYKLDVSGDLKISSGGAFGGYNPSATHRVTTPTLYAREAQIGDPAGGLKGPGSLNASNVCIEGVCQNSWSGIGGTSGWTDDGTTIRLTTISDNVGIGTAAPSAKLQVNPPANTEGLRIISSNYSPLVVRDTNDSLYLLQVDQSGNLAIKGNLTVLAGGSDVAEEFSTDENYPAGTVLVMADKGYKSARMSVEPYDNKVIGAVSDNPALLMGRVVSEKKAIVAMIGVIKVKVTTENGEINKGDPLTTSATPGHAMKATEGKIGTIIGKALENFTGGRGEIMVFVNLQ